MWWWGAFSLLSLPPPPDVKNDSYVLASLLRKLLPVPAEPAAFGSYIPKKMIMQSSQSFLVYPNVLEKQDRINNLFSWYGPFGCKTIFQS